MRTAAPAGPVRPPTSRRGSAPGASDGSWPRRTSIAALRPIAAPGPAQVCTGTPPAHPGRRPDQSTQRGRTTGATDTGLLGTRSDGCLIADLYHRDRTHLSLEKDAPEPRPVERPDHGAIVEMPVVGGLHHRYTRPVSRVRLAAVAPLLSLCSPHRTGVGPHVASLASEAQCAGRTAPAAPPGTWMG